MPEISSHVCAWVLGRLESGGAPDERAPGTRPAVPIRPSVLNKLSVPYFCPTKLMLADAMTNGVDSAALQQLLDIIFNKERQAGLSLEGTTNPKTTCGAYTSNFPSGLHMASMDQSGCMSQPLHDQSLSAFREQPLHALSAFRDQPLHALSASA